MPLFKFLSGETIDRFSGYVSPFLPNISGELERTGYFCYTDFANTAPVVFAFFGFSGDVSPSIPAVFSKMQDEFFGDIFASIQVVDASFDIESVFTGSILSIIPSVESYGSAYIGLSSFCPICYGSFSSQNQVEFDGDSCVPSVNGSFYIQGHFSFNKESLSPMLIGSFVFGEQYYVCAVEYFMPVVLGNFYSSSGFDFWSEDDSVLKNKSSRRYI